MTVSRFVKALVAQGWLSRERDPSDGRAWLLLPTDRTLAALPGFIGATNAVMDRLFAGFDDDEFAALAAAVARLRDNVEGAEEPDPGG